MIDSSHSIHIYIHPAKSCFARSSSSHVLSCPVRSHVQFNTNDRRILCRKPSLIYQSNHSSAHSENTIASRSSMLNTSKSRFGRMPKTSPVTINTKSNRILLFSLADEWIFSHRSAHFRLSNMVLPLSNLAYDEQLKVAWRQCDLFITF